MIELNITFLIQLVNFLVLIFFLNHFLFKPILSMVERRNEKMRALNADVAKYKDKAEKALEDYDRKMVEMRKEAGALLASARKEGVAEQEKILQAARGDFTKKIESARASIEKEAAEAGQTLKKTAVSLSSDVARALLGRDV